MKVSPARAARQVRTFRRRVLIVAAIPLAASQVFAAQITANWTGPNNGSFSTASYWDVAQVPLNNASNTFIVQIAGSKTVGYNTTGNQFIDQLLMDYGTGLSLYSSSLILPTSLAVLQTALIGGAIKADHSSFTAQGAGTSFLGEGVTVSAVNGAVVKIAAPSLSVKNLAGANILNAAGSGSSLDLSSLQSFNSGFNAGYGGTTNTVTASDGASINLAGLKTVVAPASNSYNLSFSATSGSSINLSSLQTVSGVTLDTGNTYFNADNSAFSLGPLQTANRMFVSLQNGATMSLGGYVGNSAITNSTFAVASGAKLNAASLTASYSARGIAGTVMLSATGLASLLDLSGLQSIDAGFNAGYGGTTNSVVASDRATINLAGVKTLVAPASNSYNLSFSATGGASINLASLQTVSGVTLESGNTSFSADNSTFLLGPLQVANRMSVSLSNSAMMTLGGYAGSAAVSNSTFAAASGATLNASTLVGSYSARGIAGGTLLSATGLGSLLNLSGLQSIDAGFNAGYGGTTNSIVASDKAAMNLSGVRTLVAPASNSYNLSVSATGGASINLSGVQSIVGVTLDTGNTNFSADNGTLVLGPVQTANRIFVALQNGATMSLGGYAGNSVITNSTFGVASGARLNAAALVGDYSFKGIAGGTVLSADGAGSLLNLSGLQSINAAFNSGYGGTTDYVVSSNSASINLSGVKIIVTPGSSSYALTFSASSGAGINLGGLQTVNTAGGGQLNLNASSGGGLQIAGIATGAGVHFNFNDAGSKLDVIGSLNLQSGSTIFAGAGTTLRVTGSYSFQQTAAAQMNLDAATLAFVGSGGQLLEVGSKHVGLPNAGSTVSGNFALGELDVGSVGGATMVSLVDAVNNGNRTGGSEALYLNGSSGNNGLHILNGSTLVLNGIDLYTTENGQWVYLNSRFSANVAQIEYDHGFIQLMPVPEPAPWALWLAGAGALAFLRKRRSCTEPLRQAGSPRCG